MKHKLLEYFLIPLFLCISLLYAAGACAQTVHNNLRSIHHHCNGAQSKQYLEAGNLVLFFAQKPIINLLSVKHTDTHETRTFFFPKLTITKKQCKQMIDEINAQQNLPYTVKIDLVTQPMEGIRFTVSYNTKTIAFGYEDYESMGQQKGMIFRFYDKIVLEKMRLQSTVPVLKTVFNTVRPRIVIDCGHGGRDVGTTGLLNIKEKEVCLSIGKSVARLLTAKGCDVFMTRTKDNTVRLDTRTLCANKYNADLFLSIHANYADNTHAKGVETFCMTPALLQPRFSTLSTQNNIFVKDFFFELSQKSSLLANSIQKYVCASVSGYHKTSIDRKVKHAPFQVLVGTRMPSALVEVGFLSNTQEAPLFKKKLYREKIAQGIYNGILAFLS